MARRYFWIGFAAGTLNALVLIGILSALLRLGAAS